MSGRIRTSWGVRVTTAVALLCCASGGESRASAQPTNRQSGTTRTRADTAHKSIASIVRRDSAGVSRTVLTSERYLITRWYARDTMAPKRMVIHETSTLHCCLDGERDTEGRIALEAWTDSINTSRTPKWRQSLVVDDGELWTQYYRATLYGCCASANALTFVYLLTGTAPFVQTQMDGVRGRDLRALTVPNSALTRRVAYLDMSTPMMPPEANRDTTVIGVLQYGPPQGPVTRVVVSEPHPSHAEYRLTDVGFAKAGRRAAIGDLDLWSANGKEQISSLTGFFVRVRLARIGDDTRELMITIPVLHDTLDLAHATKPATLQLARSAR